MEKVKTVREIIEELSRLSEEDKSKELHCMLIWLTPNQEVRCN